MAAGLSFGHSHFVATEFLQIGDCRLAFDVSCRSWRSDSCWMLVASPFRNFILYLKYIALTLRTGGFEDIT